jgi:hypothetical protein
MRRRKPRGPRQINLRLDEPLRRKLESAAKERQISTNQLMNELLAAGLEKSPEKFAESVAKAVVERMGTWPGLLASQQQKKEGGNK